MIIDFHTHAFPDNLAPRAIEILKSNCNNSPNYTDGTLKDTKEKMKLWGIDKFVVLNIATNEKQQKKVNDFAISNNGGNCIMFGSVHPFSPEAIEELDRIKAAGLKGIKLHSEYQKFDALDKRVYPVYDKIRSLNLPVVFHGGTDVAYQNTPVRCSPEAVNILSKEFNGLKIIMAHLGGYKEYSQTLQYLTGKEIYLDTSVCDTYFLREQSESLIQKHGEDYLVFGSDCPWTQVDKSVKFIESLKIPDSKKEKIFHKNAQYLLSMN